MQIGDFARLGGVSVKALRHYEDRGLLKPAWVDPSTGYRYYKLEQSAQLARIVMLRLVDFPLSEIAGLLETEQSDVLTDALNQQKAALAIEQHALAQKQAIADIISRSDESARISSLKLAALNDILVYTIEATAPHLGDPVTEIFENAEATVADLRADASPFLLFHDPPDTDGPIHIEVCIPVVSRAEGFDGVRHLSGAPLSCGIIFSGGYHQTESGYHQMTDWIKHTGLTADGPLREIYHRFGADCDGYDIPHRRLAESPAQFITELRLPIDLTVHPKETNP